MKLYKIALRNVQRHRVRSILSGSAISFAAMIIVFLFAMLAGMMDDMENNLKTYSSGDVRVRSQEYTDDEMVDSMSVPIGRSSELLALIDAMEEVEIAVPRITLSTVFQNEGVDHFAVTTAVDFEREQQFQNIDASLVPLDNTALPEAGKSQMLMTRKIAEDIGLLSVEENEIEKLSFMQEIMKLKTGSVPVETEYVLNQADKDASAFFMMASGRSALTMELTGVLQFPVGSLNGPALMMPIDRARKNLRRGDIASEIMIRVKKGTDLKAFSLKLDKIMIDNGWDDLAVTPWNEISTIFNFMQYAQVMYSVIAAMFFLLGSTVIVNTTIMVILERKKEIGTLAALGLEGKQLVQLFFMEALYIGIIGSFIGVLVGLAISFGFGVVGLDFGAAMEGIDMGVSNVIYTRPTLLSTVGIFFYSILISAIATLIPSLKAGRIKPVDALRSL